MFTIQVNEWRKQQLFCIIQKTFIWKCRDLCTLYENAVMSEDAKKQFYKTTPLIITFGTYEICYILK